jgi:hypothetical protein
VTIEERLYELLSPFVIRLYGVTPPAGTPTPYTVYLIVAQEPMHSMGDGTVTALKHWQIQFSSYADTYPPAQAQTQAIVDFLLPFRDDGIKVCLLSRRHTVLDLHVKLPESMAEFDILESIA